MKTVAAILALSLCCVNAQIGSSGIVSPDGNNVQFTRDFAQGIVLRGPSGIVSTGGNLQLTSAQAAAFRAKRSLPIFAPLGSVFGPSGYITPEGVNVQFTPEQADNIAVSGPSGVVLKDGGHVQFHRKKRSAAAITNVPVGSVFGPSGYITPEGRGVQFTAEQADNILFSGPSGVITKDGSNVQFVAPRTKRAAPAETIVGESGLITPDGQNIQFKSAGVSILLEGPSAYILSDGSLIQKRQKRSAAAITNVPVGSVFGPSGYITPEGRGVQFTAEQADNILFSGPSGVITKDGSNVQFVAPRTKRSAITNVPVGSVFGPSGYITPEGRGVQFTAEQADNILFSGPSGVITKDGSNVQFVAPRTKRAAPAETIVGASGLITPDGQNIQFKNAGVSILLEGPSAYILSDGSLIQKRHKRHVLGDSGIITKDGQNVQFKEGGVKIVLEGPSGILFSDGTVLQKKF